MSIPTLIFVSLAGFLMLYASGALGKAAGVENIRMEDSKGQAKVIHEEQHVQTESGDIRIEKEVQKGGDRVRVHVESHVGKPLGEADRKEIERKKKELEERWRERMKRFQSRAE